MSICRCTLSSDPNPLLPLAEGEEGVSKTGVLRDGRIHTASVSTVRDIRDIRDMREYVRDMIGPSIQGVRIYRPFDGFVLSCVGCDDDSSLGLSISCRLSDMRRTLLSTGSDDA